VWRAAPRKRAAHAEQKARKAVAAAATAAVPAAAAPTPAAEAAAAAVATAEAKVARNAGTPAAAAAALAGGTDGTLPTGFEVMITFEAMSAGFKYAKLADALPELLLPKVADAHEKVAMIARRLGSGSGGGGGSSVVHVQITVQSNAEDEAHTLMGELKSRANTLVQVIGGGDGGGSGCCVLLCGGRARPRLDFAVNPVIRVRAARAAWVRSTGCVYPEGGVLLDHPGDGRTASVGSDHWWRTTAWRHAQRAQTPLHAWAQARQHDARYVIPAHLVAALRAGPSGQPPRGHAWTVGYGGPGASTRNTANGAGPSGLRPQDR
jgi:hypothetical protein